MRLPFPVSAVLLFAGIALQGASGNMGFVEEFALAQDRAAALGKLIPGTPQYYYYHCLHYQNTGVLGQADDMLQRWAEKHGESSELEAMRNRQALLRYPDDPKRALQRIREELKLSFDDTRQAREGETTYPSRLDPRLLDRDLLDRLAFETDELLEAFRAPAYRRLARKELTWQQRRALLQLLDSADVPNLVDLVVADLKQPDGDGFGMISIHHRLTLAQLDACAERLPELLANRIFVSEYLARLAPSAAEDWQDPAVRLPFLERLQAFADRLPAVWNGIKARALYHRLEFDRTQDVYSRERLLAYLRLPRVAPYVRREYLDKPEFRGVEVKFTDGDALVVDLPAIRVLAPIGNDEPLVRAFLHRLLADTEGYADFAPYLEESYIREVFAEANILAGTGDQERWHAMIPPARLQALLDRVDIELLPTCPQHFGIGDPVRLSVAVKNVPSLLVRIYEINTFNYYRSREREIDTAVELDGLIPEREQTHAYDQPPLRRHVETFAFPELDRPGVWVVEFVGNGRSSRALIRKGQLRPIVRQGAAGHVFRVYDEANRLVKDASLWLGSQEFRPDEGGEIVVPYRLGEDQGRSFVLRRGDVAALGHFKHRSEEYRLQTRYWLSEESLLPGTRAKVIAEPVVTVAGGRIGVPCLDWGRLYFLHFSPYGRHGGVSLGDVVFKDDRAAVGEFEVFEGLGKLMLSSGGRIKRLTDGTEVCPSDSRELLVDHVPGIGSVAYFYLRPTRDGYVLELRGVSGEPLPRRAVAVRLRHVDYVRPVMLAMQTDDTGRIWLGELPGIERIEAAAAGTRLGVELEETRGNLCDYPEDVVATVGETISLPFPGGTAERLALFSVSSVEGLLGVDAPIRDWREAATVDAGQVAIQDLPIGMYRLALRRENGVTLPAIHIAVVPGVRRGECILGPRETVGARVPKLLGVRSATVEGDGATRQLVVRLNNATPSTRVHVQIGRYAGSSWFQAAPDGAGKTWAPAHGLALGSRYVSGRDLGDELRYVLDRRNLPARPGNMLAKPSLLVRPWSPSWTTSEREELKEGEEYQPSAPAPSGAMLADDGDLSVGVGGWDGRDRGGIPHGPFGFLPNPSLVAANLIPDENGVVTLDFEPAGRQYIRALAMNARDTVMATVLLPMPTDETPRDLRVASGLDAGQHYVERSAAEIAGGDKVVRIADRRRSVVAVYGTVGHAFRLLSPDAPSIERRSDEDSEDEEVPDAPWLHFSFLCRWPEFGTKEQQELYGDHACSELDFFLFHKDRAFFDAVVRPQLAAKRHKTFLDHWLLGDDLTAYLEPWEFSRLNVPECILLAQRCPPAEADRIRELIEQRYDALRDGLSVRGLWSALPEADGVGLVDDGEALSFRGSDALGTSAIHAPDLLQTARTRKRAAHIDWGGDDDDDDDDDDNDGTVADLEELFGSASTAEETVMKRRRSMAITTRSRAKAAAGEDEEDEETPKWFDGDRARRDTVRQLFRGPKRTQVWVEGDYCRRQPSLAHTFPIGVNAFWRDYARYRSDGPFLSTSLHEATGSFAEKLLALAVLDLPFRSDSLKISTVGEGLEIRADQPFIAYHRQLLPVAAPAAKTGVVVRQRVIDPGMTTRGESGGPQAEVGSELLTAHGYGITAEVSNTTDREATVDLLMFMPDGSVPIGRVGTRYSFRMVIPPHQTQMQSCSLYFPRAGDYIGRPAEVSQDGQLLASSGELPFHVVAEPSRVDTTSWYRVSQFGSEEDVLSFLRNSKELEGLDLDRIAFRMQDKGFFGRTLALLRERRVFRAKLWSYAVLHNDAEAIREYLPGTALASRCGTGLQSPLLTVDPVARCEYAHLEFWPLLNARAHRVGGQAQILDNGLRRQYGAFLDVLAHRARLGDEDYLELAVYLVMQDRVEEAVKALGRVAPDQVAERVQYDYLKAYLAFSQGDPKAAQAIARGYAEHPVPRWRALFADVLAQCREIEGATAAADNPNRTQGVLAATQPGFEFFLEGDEIRLEARNLDAVEVNFYRMDLELLFSRSPFDMDVGDLFSIVRPNSTVKVEVGKGARTKRISLPKAFAQTNTMVEVVGGGLRKTKPYYPSLMTVQVIEAYGQLHVARTDGRKPLPAVYVKAYARDKAGKVAFYKDGYTDLRGRFDYAGVSTQSIEHVEQFALLVLSKETGAVVLVVEPPPQ